MGTAGIGRRGPLADDVLVKALEAALSDVAAHRGLDPADPLVRTHLLASAEAALRPLTQAAVDGVRAGGTGWGEVGDLFGIAASAAWTRFRKVPVQAVPWPPPAD